MKIQSDNAAIEKNLRFMEKTIEEYDGGIDPDMVIRCENGGMSVEKHGPNKKRPLIVLPAELLLPTKQLNITAKGNEISIDPEKKGLSDVQRKLADCMFEIYNLTNKMAIHRESHPWFMFRAAPQYMDKILESRSKNERQKKFTDIMRNKPAEGTPEFDDALCDSYIHTRTLGHKEVDEETKESAMTTNIMPIVDFINHHFDGASFGFDKGYLSHQPEREFMAFADSRPILTSNECFAFYTQMDTLDAFLSYGFPDASAPIIRSVPIDIEIEKAGTLKINSFLSSWKKGKLHKNVAGLRPYIPITMRKDENLLEVTHMLIPCGGQAQHALRRVLRLMISSMAPKALTSEEVWQNVLMAEEKILDANIDFYRRLLKDLEEDKNDNDPGTKEGHCKQLVLDITRTQLTKLYKYSYSNDSLGVQEDTPQVAAAAE